MYYKNENNEVFFLDSNNDVDYLPDDCVEITDQEADSLLNKPPTVDQQIAALETVRDNALSTMTYDFGDGNVIRTAPEDEANMKRRISKNQTKRWRLVPGCPTRVFTPTPAQLQVALDAAEINGEQIFDDFFDALEAL